MNVGEGFHARSPRSDRKHLYLAITAPDAEGKQVYVNLTSQGQVKDQSCVLRVGDHPFIKHDTVINYSDAIMPTEEAIFAGARGGAIQYDPAPVTAEALRRIQEGALASPHTEAGIKAAVQAFLSP